MATRILSCPFPENLNPLSPNGFKFSIEKLPQLTYFCQEVNLPEIILGDIFQTNPLTNIALPGDQLTYGMLSINFLVDSKMENYRAIYNWMVGLGFPENNSQFTDLVGSSAQNATSSEAASVYSDATLMILDSYNKPSAEIKFVDMIPVSLQGLTFASTADDVQYLVGRADFRYTYYQFV